MKLRLVASITPRSPFTITIEVYNDSADNLISVPLSGVYWLESEANGDAIRYEFNDETSSRVSQLSETQRLEIADVIEEHLRKI